MELDAVEAEKSRKKQEDDMDKKIEDTYVLKFMAENKKNQQFKNKKFDELELLLK